MNNFLNHISHLFEHFYADWNQFYMKLSDYINIVLNTNSFTDISYYGNFDRVGANKKCREACSQSARANQVRRN